MSEWTLRGPGGTVIAIEKVALNRAVVEVADPDGLWVRRECDGPITVSAIVSGTDGDMRALSCQQQGFAYADGE